MTRIDTTLLKDFSTLAVKKFDLDFTVDPLFKKTSADFDEGGARGLLLNHLSLDQNCKIIFDASDATVEGELEDAGNEQAIMSIEHIDPEEPVDSENEDDASSSDEAGSDLEIEEVKVKPDPADQEQPDLDKDVEMKESEVDANKDDETKEDQADNKKEDEAKEDQADNNKEDETKEGQADSDKEGKVNEDEQEKKDPSSIADQQSKEGSPSAQEKPAIVVQGEDNIKENSPIATHINEESRVEIYRLKGRLNMYCS